MVTCVTLLLLMETWRPSRGAVWILQEKAGQAVGVGFLLSWVALFYSLALTGLGSRTGLAPWWARARIVCSGIRLISAFSG